MTIMNFHKSIMSTKMCVCQVLNGVGYDAFGNKYKVISDDFGNQVFVSNY